MDSRLPPHPVPGLVPASPDSPALAVEPVDVPNLRPTPPLRRLVTIDILRGVAILGILVLNIRSFAMPSMSYSSPFAWEEPSSLDYWTFVATHVLAEGKFLSIFAILFGAGLLLSSRRYEPHGHWTAEATLVQYRRLGVLAVIGLLHMTLLWHGDILFFYAVVGAVVFLMRHWPIRVQALTAASAVLIGLLFGLAVSGLTALGAQHDPSVAEAFAMTTDPAEVEAYRGGWLEQMAWRLPTAAQQQIAALFFYGPAGVGLMLLGMILLRTGVLGGDRSGLFYALGAAACLLLGYAASAVLAWWGHVTRWEGINWILAGMPLREVAAGIAAVGLLLAIVGLARHATGPPAIWLAAVGRMAFTNYLLQTVICTTIFYGHGFGYFGHLGYFHQQLIVVPIWIVLILFSVLWLRYYRFGPMEWLWRCLTYGRWVFNWRQASLQ